MLGEGAAWICGPELTLLLREGFVMHPAQANRKSRTLHAPGHFKKYQQGNVPSLQSMSDNRIDQRKSCCQKVPASRRGTLFVPWRLVRFRRPGRRGGVEIPQRPFRQANPIGSRRDRKTREAGRKRDCPGESLAHRSGTTGIAEPGCC